MRKLQHKEAAITRVAAYCRVSTEEQAIEGHSIETQLEQAEKWCQRSLPQDSYHLEPYRDEGLSGKLGWEPPKRGRKKYRPELARLAADIEAGRIDLVIVYRMDRLTRSVSVWASFAERYLSAGMARFVSLNEGVDLSKNEGRLLAHILAAVAAFQREIISSNVCDALQRRKREGLPLGRNYGWRSVPPAAPGSRPTVEPDPERAPWVPRMFEWLLRGWRARRIARELDRQGAPPFPGSPVWAWPTVTRILSNPLHAGYVQAGNELVKAQSYDQRLIDRETFDAAQRELASRKREGKHPAHGEPQLLYKVARCKACGQFVQAFRDPDTGSTSYRCHGSNDLHQTTCRGWSKDTRLVDRVVLRQLLGFVQRPEFQQVLSDEAREELMAEKLAELVSEQGRLQRLLQQKEEEERLLLRAYTKGRASEANYNEEYECLQSDKEHIAAELGTVEFQLAAETARTRLLQEVQRVARELPELWDELNAEERRHLLREITEYCYMEPLGNKRHRIVLKFHFLPAVSEELPFSRGRMTGLFDGVAHLSKRELAYIALRSDGQSDREIEAVWEVTPQATYYLRTSALKRLGVASVEEAIALAQGRIDQERPELPLGPSDWHVGRPRGERLRPRAKEALIRYIETGDVTRVATAMGLKVNSVGVHLWYARKALGCETLADAAEKYLEQTGGSLAPVAGSTTNPAEGVGSDVSGP